MKNKILIFKTAADNVMYKLFDSISKDSDVTCLIQSSVLDYFKGKYPEIRYIDIGGEGFYNVEDLIIKEVGNQKYDKIILPSTGTRFHNFHNILDIVKKLKFENLVLFNCDGEIKYLKLAPVSEYLCRILVGFFTKMYKLKSRKG